MSDKHPARSAEKRPHGVPNYGVLVGRPTEARCFHPKDEPQFHILVQSGAAECDIAINVLSRSRAELLYCIKDQAPPRADALLDLHDGFSAIPQRDVGGLGVDFIRQRLVSKAEMQMVSIGNDLDQSDLHDHLRELINEIQASGEARLFAFGNNVGGKGENPLWRFSPDQRVIDVHMNQGNPSYDADGRPVSNDNGVFQDGALFAFFPAGYKWKSVFIAFQTQNWDTDSGGNPISELLSR